MDKEAIKSFLKENISNETLLKTKFERLDNYFKQEAIQKTNDTLYTAILKVLLLCCDENEEIDISTIIKNIEYYCKEFKSGVKKGSLRLADKCFNQCNNTGCIKTVNGYEFNVKKYNSNPHFFEKVDGGFKIISKYNGSIIEKHRNASGKIVGYWKDGQIIKKPEKNEVNLIDNKQNEDKKMTINIPLNQILYGPPGTGKTYNTVIRTMEIIGLKELFRNWYMETSNAQYKDKTFKDYCNAIEVLDVNFEVPIFHIIDKNIFEKLKFKITNSEFFINECKHATSSKGTSYYDSALNQYGKFLNCLTYEYLKNKFDELKQTGQIEFVTFHQSYSYEEFVEGIKPKITQWGEENPEDINYIGKDGIFKKICKIAERDLYLTKDDKEITFDKIYQMFQEKYPTGSDFSNLLNIKYETNNLVYHFGSQSGDRRIEINKIKEIFNSNKKYSTSIEFNQDYKGNPPLKGYFFNFYKELLQIKEDYIDGNKNKSNINNEALNYVLIIDEINRGNISKIFGELITLIEEDKRSNLMVKLPYSQEEFTVPKNLYIIGTMNTSDRSIASIDIALRRRFKFVEMMPNSDLVADFECNFREIFEKLNNKIKILLDRDHQIGHSYFIKTKYANADIDTLKDIWFSEIIPLLNEYFYCDWDKLKLIIPGFIKEIDIPDYLKNECDEVVCEFKTPNEIEDFLVALNQEKFE